jgi:hypothetical protein
MTRRRQPRRAVEGETALMATLSREKPGMSLGWARSTRRRPSTKLVLSAEALEERRLLSTSEPFFKFNTVGFGGVGYILTVSGPGLVKTEKCGHHSVSIKLVGTTQDSTLAISALTSRTLNATTPLSVMSIHVSSGRLGSISGLTSTDLEGPISNLQGPVTSLQFDAIGPKARINILSGNSGKPGVNGNLGQLTVNRGITVGPTGFIDVGNDLTGALSVATNVTLNGGQIDIGRDLDGAFSIGGNLTINEGGQIKVTRNLGTTAASSTTTSPTSSSSGASASASSTTAAAPSGGSGVSVSGDVALDNGTFTVGGSVGSLTVGGSLEASQGGGIAVAGNLASLTVNGGVGSSTGNLTLNPGGSITVGGNVTTMTVANSVQLDSSPGLQVGGNLSGLTVGGNLQTSSGGQLNVAGDLGTVSVTGVVLGQGPGGPAGIMVGDDLAQLTVLGGGNGLQGLQGVNITVKNNIQGLDIRNGIANSTIQAGFLINGGTPGTGSNGWNIGPDGATSPSSVDPEMGQIAILNSTIQAGYEIQNMTIGGDVVCDQPTTPTRIVAGETIQGQFVPNGVIDTFQIIGNLVNSVVAASAGPNPSTGQYDKPAGSIEAGFLSSPSSTAPIAGAPTVTVQTSGVSNVGLATSTATSVAQAAQLQSSPVILSTAPPFANAADPELPEVLSGGVINPSLAPKLQLLPPAASAGTELPLPTKSTILGSVITTAAWTGDYAGFFATNANGVFVGQLPTSEPVSAAP